MFMDHKSTDINRSRLFNRLARLAQSVERQALNLVVEGSSPSVGDFFILFGYSHQQTFGFGAFRITQKGHIRTILI